MSSRPASEYPHDRVEIACDHCGRRGSSKRKRFAEIVGRPRLCQRRSLSMGASTLRWKDSEPFACNRALSIILEPLTL